MPSTTTFIVTYIKPTTKNEYIDDNKDDDDDDGGDDGDDNNVDDNDDDIIDDHDRINSRGVPIVNDADADDDM